MWDQTDFDHGYEPLKNEYMYSMSVSCWWEPKDKWMMKESTTGFRWKDGRSDWNKKENQEGGV